MDLLRSTEIRVRAVDSSNNMMPEKLTWNLMGALRPFMTVLSFRDQQKGVAAWLNPLLACAGMMNNPHYRVKVHVDTTQQGQMAMRFEHPTKSGSEAGGCAPLSGSSPPAVDGLCLHACTSIQRALDQGAASSNACRWMEREYGHHVAQSLPQDSDTGASAKKIMDEGALPAYTLEQVEEHDSRKSVWFVHEGKVYDGTKFLNDHPGGAESILIVAGQVRVPAACR